MVARDQTRFCCEEDRLVGGERLQGLKIAGVVSAFVVEVWSFTRFQHTPARSCVAFSRERLHCGNSKDQCAAVHETASKLRIGALRTSVDCFAGSGGLPKQQVNVCESRERRKIRHCHWMRSGISRRGEAVSDINHLQHPVLARSGWLGRVAVTCRRGA